MKETRNWMGVRDEGRWRRIGGTGGDYERMGKRKGGEEG